MNVVKNTHERGNVLFLILIAVALFAALGFSVSNILQSGNPTTIAGEQARVFASEILDYGRNMRQAVQNVKISNGCRDTEISFENNIETGYTNGANTECQVFHPDGGAMSWISPANSVNDGSEWIFAGTNHADNIGSAAPELVMILRNINSNICNSINTVSGITVLGSDATIDFTKFTGVYTATQTIDSAADTMAGCLNHDNGGTDEPFFYQVLIAR